MKKPNVKRPDLQPESSKGQWILLGITVLTLCSLASALLMWRFPDVLEGLELKTYDIRVAMSGHQHLPSKEIALVEFDDTTLSTFEDEHGAWPWSRSVYADMIEFLEQAGAKALVFDMLFIGKDKNNEASDQALVEAFERYPNVYMGLTFDNNWRGCNILKGYITRQDGEKIQPLALPLTSQMKAGFFESSALRFNSFRGRVIPELLDVRDRMGFVNNAPDPDGVTRGNPLVFRLEYPDEASQPVVRYYPYLALKLWMDLEEPQDAAVTLTPDGTLLFAKTVSIPLASDGNYLIRWYNEDFDKMEARTMLKSLETRKSRLLSHPIQDPAEQLTSVAMTEGQIRVFKNILHQPLEGKPYQQMGAWEILNAMKDQRDGTLTEADQAVLKAVKNRILFIGTTATATSAHKTTPMGKLIPGVLLQATIFDNLSQGQGFLHRVDGRLNLGFTLLLCSLGAFFILRMPSLVYGVVTGLLMVMLYVLLAFSAFQYASLWIDIAFPLLAWATVSILAGMGKYILRDRDYQKTYRIATTDGLTGLYNHQYFKEQLNHWITTYRQGEEHFSLLLIDIDFFKAFNDQFGHQVGDDVLRHVAQRLKTSVRTQDLVARYGGEEMAILLHGVDLPIAMEIAQKLLRAVGEAPFSIREDETAQVTISIGVASYPQQGRTPTDLISTADQALYRAKHNGRNQVVGSIE